MISEELLQKFFQESLNKALGSAKAKDFSMAEWYEGRASAFAAAMNLSESEEADKMVRELREDIKQLREAEGKHANSTCK